MLINLTPHPIRIYPVDTPDRIDPTEHLPTLVLEPSTDYPTARIGQIDLGTQQVAGIPVPVEYVEFGRLENPPPRPGPDDLPVIHWYVVSLVAALGAQDRHDLLVPYGEVRNLEGAVVGCRLLARPV